MRHCFNILAGKVPIFQQGPSLGLREGQGDTPGKSWWGYAARSSKSWPYFRPKNVIFLTQRKYCVVLSIYMVYIREFPGAQRSSQSRALRVLLIQSRGMNPQPPRYIYWPTNHASFNSELYRGSTLFCWRLPFRLLRLLSKSDLTHGQWDV